MREYETLMVFHPDLQEDGVRGRIERFRGILAGEGASMRQVVEWGMRDLAYPISKQCRGYYVLFEYDAEPKAVRELERNLGLADEVLRFVSVRRTVPPPRSPGPQARPSGSPQRPEHGEIDDRGE